MCTLVSVCVGGLIADSCGLVMLWVLVDSCFRGSIAGFMFWGLCISACVGLWCLGIVLFVVCCLAGCWCLLFVFRKLAVWGCLVIDFVVPGWCWVAGVGFVLLFNSVDYVILCVVWLL